MRISGSNVLITGATGGIGETIARTFAARGARLMLSGRRKDALDDLAGELGARAVPADLADPQDVARLCETCGDTDILVANAALPASGDVLEYTPEQIRRALLVNLEAPIMLSRLLAPRMARAGRGHLALVGSISGKAATKATAMYNATKFGLRGFALALRQDLQPAGVGVSLVQPGFVRDAGMFAATGVALPPGMRTVSPQQVADGVVRAVTRNLCEVNVAPLELRMLSSVAGQFPALSEQVQRRFGVTDDTVTGIVDAQRARR
ncbi:SDR family NAD(P)-dependent oxidoreductase [Streptomyces sp. NPDC002952]|uniref:SDR family NAD(P)-dependent oxidoreductase n=1 Tax=Streptomyces sp. NPDC002952 TaxID=3364673 RepID=UPI0036C8199F